MVDESKIIKTLEENNYLQEEGVKVESGEKYLSSDDDETVIVSTSEYVEDIRKLFHDRGHLTDKKFLITDKWGMYVISFK